MTRLSPQEIARRHGIPYVVNARNGKYTARCRECGKNYLSVRTNYVDEFCWICRDCGWSGPGPGSGGGDGGGGGRGGGAGAGASRGGGGDSSNGGLGEPVVVYDYTDEHGQRLFQVLKFEPPGQPKTFRQRTGPNQVKWSISC